MAGGGGAGSESWLDIRGVRLSAADGAAEVDGVGSCFTSCNSALVFPFTDFVGETLELVFTSEAERVWGPSVGVGVASSGTPIPFPFRKGVALRRGRSSSEAAEVVPSVSVLLSLSRWRGIFVPPSVSLECTDHSSARA
jgi:hypothetical protein